MYSLTHANDHLDCYLFTLNPVKRHELIAIDTHKQTMSGINRHLNVQSVNEAPQVPHLERIDVVFCNRENIAQVPGCYLMLNNVWKTCDQNQYYGAPIINNRRYGEKGTPTLR